MIVKSYNINYNNYYSKFITMASYVDIPLGPTGLKLGLYPPKLPPQQVLYM